jgi:hypothetical protein
VSVYSGQLPYPLMLLIYNLKNLLLSCVNINEKTNTGTRGMKIVVCQQHEKCCGRGMN